MAPPTRTRSDSDNKGMSRLEKIRQLYRNNKDDKPKDEIWEYCESGKDAEERSLRWKAASAFARKHRDEARDEDSRDMWDFAAETYRAKYRHSKEVADEQAEKRARSKDKDDDGITLFDGKPVTSDWAKVLKACRETDLWHGSLTSGYRTPEYSEGLCIQICGQPTCPGRCAGRGSNHSKPTIASGAAVDVSDPQGFRQALIKVGRSELHNALGAADPWHFSITGR